MSHTPIDATHRSQVNGRFYKFVGDKLMVWQQSATNPGWFTSLNTGANLRLLPLLHQPDPVPVWTGEGLPPVGLVCERAFSHSAWKATTICGHSTDGAYASFYDGDGLMGWNDHCKFRPIRTPEQIAADERRAGIEALGNDINRRLDFCFNIDEIEGLYDGGYRAVVAP